MGRSTKIGKNTVYDGYKVFFSDLVTELGGIDAWERA